MQNQINFKRVFSSSDQDKHINIELSPDKIKKTLEEYEARPKYNPAQPQRNSEYLN